MAGWRDGHNYETGAALRRACRSGAHQGPTNGCAPGYVQVNLVILPQAEAQSFQAFCLANPASCPLLAVSEPGGTALPGLGTDIDVRTDAPSYRVFREGTPVAEASDLGDYWRNDLVAAAIGCSFSFEQALAASDLSVRHNELGRNVPMYVTDWPCTPAGPFQGPTVVSMRPYTPAQAIRAVQVTSRYPRVHGAPLHLGAPEQIGVADLTHPDYGDSPDIRTGELPVFWGCGVTPQVALQAARPAIAFTHKPGHMLVTDRHHEELAAL